MSLSLIKKIYKNKILINHLEKIGFNLCSVFNKNHCVVYTFEKKIKKLNKVLFISFNGSKYSMAKMINNKVTDFDKGYKFGYNAIKKYANDFSNNA
jgi:hypothetical protein